VTGIASQTAYLAEFTQGASQTKGIRVRTSAAQTLFEIRHGSLAFSRQAGSDMISYTAPTINGIAPLYVGGANTVVDLHNMKMDAFGNTYFSANVVNQGTIRVHGNNINFPSLSVLASPGQVADVFGIRDATNATQWVSVTGSGILRAHMGYRSADGTDGATAIVGDSQYKNGLFVSEAGAATLTDAATIAVDGALGGTFEVTLGGNRTLGNPSNVTKDGHKIVFRIKQDASGGRILTLGSRYRFGSDITAGQFVLTTTPGKSDLFGVIYNLADDKFDVVALARGF
jgi:hypothetical protein